MVCGEASWGTVYEMVSRMKPYCESVRPSVRPVRLHVTTDDRSVDGPRLAIASEWGDGDGGRGDGVGGGARVGS